jgi:hypothetical protein
MTPSAKVENGLRWQTVSASRSCSPAAGPAGRRLAPSFSVGLARSFAQWDSARRARIADWASAASGDNSVIGLPWGSAARRDVVRRVVFGGTDERASPRGVLGWAMQGGRRRGRLGREAAVSVPRELIAWR